MSGTPTYESWHQMIQRCTNPKNDSFDRYGGRGIAVCKRWLASFPAFLEDMGARPSFKHSIERCENSGNYEPGNCRWATKKEQQRNMRSNRMLTHDGKTMCLAAWAEQIGLSTLSLSSRLRLGWTVEEALTIPIGEKRENWYDQRNHLITFNGITLCVSEWAKQLGIKPFTLRKRFSYGWTVERALTSPARSYSPSPSTA